MLRVDSASGVLIAGDREIACTIGEGGACPASVKHEGDGCTPLGIWPVRGVLLRTDRLAVPPGLRLPWRAIRWDDGWSDDPRDSAYNRPVRHPHRFSAERLWREDGLYDVIVVLGHNDAPPTPGAGSAIFFHVSLGQPTAGCVAIPLREMLALLPALAPGDTVEVA